MSTLGQALEEAIEGLQSVSATPRLDAEVLLMESAGCSRASLIAFPERTLDPASLARFRGWVERRAGGEPVALITGWREFHSLRFSVAPGVLVPRPETELLVERGLASIPPATGARIADLGTGSGAVAVAIALERPHADVLATDVSPEALAVAGYNAARLGAANLRLRQGSWCDALADEPPFDLIVSNPPYVADGDPCLERPPLCFEPRRALAAGADGLDAIRRIVDGAGRHLAPGAHLLIEHGSGQDRAVTGILRDAGFGSVSTWQDLAGLPRVSGGRWPGSLEAQPARARSNSA